MPSLCRHPASEEQEVEVPVVGKPGKFCMGQPYTTPCPLLSASPGYAHPSLPATYVTLESLKKKNKCEGKPMGEADLADCLGVLARSQNQGRPVGRKGQVHAAGSGRARHTPRAPLPRTPCPSVRPLHGMRPNFRTAIGQGGVLDGTPP